MPYIKILKNGRKYDLGRDTKCSVLDILNLECLQVFPVMHKIYFGGCYPKVCILGTNCEFSVYKKKWIKSFKDKRQRMNRNC